MTFKDLWREQLIKEYKITVGNRPNDYYQGFTDCLRFMDGKVKVLRERIKVMEHLREQEKNDLERYKSIVWETIESEVRDYRKFNLSPLCDRILKRLGYELK
jgi:hypothetical protein